jgi:hypothetical protein
MLGSGTRQGSPLEAGSWRVLGTRGQGRMVGQVDRTYHSHVSERWTHAHVAHAARNTIPLIGTTRLPTLADR